MKKIVLTILLGITLMSCDGQPPVLTIPKDSITVKDVQLAVYTLPFKFKKIVVAQAVLETGWFTSKNFKVNNNLFGMRVPYSRMTTADTAINGYAHYKKWEESIIDYYLMLSVRNDIKSINTEEAYYHYLDYIYSEVGRSYSSQLKDIIARLKLEDFDNEPTQVYHSKKFTPHKKRTKRVKNRVSAPK
jgi:hypothetical protein